MYREYVRQMRKLNANLDAEMFLVVKCFHE